MRIVIDSGSYHCLNVGDVAMLQAGVGRLRSLWPDATIAAVTNAPATLARHCPDVKPIPLAGRVALLSDRLFGRADRFLPRPIQGVLTDVQQRMRIGWPTGLSSLIAVKRALVLRSDYAAAREYVCAIRGAQLVMATGAGVLTDAFFENAMGVLATLAVAQQCGIATALMGQGIGPVTKPALGQAIAAVLPRARLITLRERRESLQYLQSIGVEADRVVVSGDDAIEMSFCQARAELGDGIGVNVRIAAYAEIDANAVDILRPALQRAAAELSARLVPLPIAHHPDCHDGVAIRDVLSDPSDTPHGRAELPTPDAAIDAVSRCRVVVTGSYHAAVFALAQGIPVVALARSSYYRNKFSGVAELFGGGCTVITLDGSASSDDVMRAIVAGWTRAPSTRPALLRAAAAQIEQGRAAYRRLSSIAATSSR